MMKKILLALLVISAAPVAFASPELAKARNCMACHAVATKMVGPSFKDIAAKYASDKDAEDKLVVKVQKGSTGAWGPVPMPANPQVNEADAHTLVKWILTQK
jgi:cytochrome c